MKLSVIALDYDGTIARGDLVDPSVRDAIATARTRTLAASGNLPTAPRGRRRLLLGHLEDGREFTLVIRGRNVLISGDMKSGKSWGRCD